MIYVDEPKWPYRGKVYCHLFTDGDVTELLLFAEEIGLKRAWYQNPYPYDHPHFDISPARRIMALRRGAQFMSGKDWIRKIVIPKRKAQIQE